MPRIMAPPPSGEFNIQLRKPFSGSPKHTIEVIGEPNRSAVVRSIHYTGADTSNEKVGDVSKDDVNELMELVLALRGFPSNPNEDSYGFDTVVDFNTFDIQWSNADEGPAGDVITQLAGEQRDEFKRIADSIEALARQFATKDSAV